MADYRVLRVVDIDSTEHNVNVMDDGEFNALCEGIQESGFIPPVVVAERNGRYMMIDGNHRLRAAQILGYDVIPGYVVEVGSDEALEVQAARMNVVRGHIDRSVFTRLYLQQR